MRLPFWLLFWRWITNTRACPKCKYDKIIPIVYGYPDEKLRKEAKEGKVILGGCELSNEKWFCNKCKESW